MNDERASADTGHADDLRAFLVVVRRALLMVVDWIDGRYQLPPPGRYREHRRK